MRRDVEQKTEKHDIEAVVITCVDWRFKDNVSQAVFSKALFVAFDVGKFFEVRLAGGAKNISSPDKEGRREAVLDDIRLAQKKHVNTLILLNHGNGCAKYAEDGFRFFVDPDTERIFHEKELRLAGDIAFRHFPDMKILLGYATVGADGTIKIDRIMPSGVSSPAE